MLGAFVEIAWAPRPDGASDAWECVLALGRRDGADSRNDMLILTPSGILSLAVPLLEAYYLEQTTPTHVQ